MSSPGEQRRETASVKQPKLSVVAEAELGDHSDSPSELWKRGERMRAAEDAN